MIKAPFTREELSKAGSLAKMWHGCKISQDVHRVKGLLFLLSQVLRIKTKWDNWRSSIADVLLWYPINGQMEQKKENKRTQCNCKEWSAPQGNMSTKSTGKCQVQEQREEQKI